ncbi:MAG: nicotinate-nucleotide--dimethylbenzimidazole phosphoribosyltransferase [Spirochaetaceae bacterium]|jgi:nicotinate-nucleotide--dimethylbenzimidazole phosphoribosyltransferase|nr:nicotinate-nucleotide--dimethylbenzimidazole phosphoribosyltransferase [Spirochaetaceae bacterium]
MESTEAIEVKMSRHLDNLTKPLGSLGRLEDYCIKLAKIQGKVPPPAQKKCVYVFGGDHGVAAEGVSLYPPEVSYQQATNMLYGGAGINALATATGWEIAVVDAGINADFPPELIRGAAEAVPPKGRFIDAKIGRGTKNFYHEDAMSAAELEAALKKGAEVAEDAIRRGYTMVAVGDLGIANTATGAAMLVAAGLDHNLIIDRGTGIDEAALKHKRQVITEAVRLRAPGSAPRAIMRALGGFDLAEMTGFILALKGKGIACILDGFPVTSAAYMAWLIDNSITDYLFAGHLSRVSGHRVVLDKMGLEPAISLGMRLGEGTGAVIGGFIVELGAVCARDMATFDTVDVSQAPTEEIKF